ncbi:hypothetical protein [Burkholderia cenocepacia]|uniref:hypothetical protein n=1 Tax=Burkholderia cenocepacia TaxID=95486 RepID=UPI002230E2C0|nr:hypothetical protein [Burkholderia cenocepacia]
MQTKPKQMLLKQAEIRREIPLQTRAGINSATVEEYRDALLAGAKFPRVVVFFDKMYYYLADGWHRYEAYVAARIDEIPADMYEGTRRDAQLYALGANASHGLRRTNDDKRRAVSLMLEDSEWSCWSDSEIARSCRVSQPFVGKVRTALSQNIIGESQPGNVTGDDVAWPFDEGARERVPQCAAAEALTDSVQGDRLRTYTTKHGTQAVMKTANLGREPRSKGENPPSIPEAGIPASPDGSTVFRDASPPELESASELAARTDAVAIKPPFRQQAIAESSSEAVISELREQISSLADELDEARRELDAYHACEAGEGEKKLIGANKEISRLEGEIRRLQARRDDLMNENAELKKEVKRLRKQLGYKANG